MRATLADWQFEHAVGRKEVRAEAVQTAGARGRALFLALARVICRFLELAAVGSCGCSTTKVQPEWSN